MNVQTSERIFVSVPIGGDATVTLKIKKPPAGREAAVRDRFAVNVTSWNEWRAELAAPARDIPHILAVIDPDPDNVTVDPGPSIRPLEHSSALAHALADALRHDASVTSVGGAVPSGRFEGVTVGSDGECFLKQGVAVDIVRRL